MSLRRSLPAGVADAAGAALGTFSVGTFAVRYLTADELGVYALCFVTFTLASLVPSRLWFLPAEVHLIKLPEPHRIQGFRLTLGWGLLVALAASPIALLAWIPVAGEDPSVVAPLALTAAATTIMSTVQDHVRRTMHLGMRSSLAAVMSGVQVTVVLVALGAALLLDVPRVWVPFGALVVANVVSTSVGLILGVRYGRRPARSRYAFADLAPSGRWLLLAASLPVGSSFVVRSLVVLVAASSTLGLAEAARIAANPYFVFLTGVSAVVNPQALKAGASRDAGRVRQLNGVVDRIAAYALVPTLLLLGFDWPGNPMAHLLPRAYETSGLALLSCVAMVPAAMLLPRLAALIGAQREPEVAAVSLIGGLVRVLVGLSVFFVDEFAIPLSTLAHSSVIVLGCRATWRRHLRSGADSTAARRLPREPRHMAT